MSTPKAEAAEKPEAQPDPAPPKKADDPPPTPAPAGPFQPSWDSLKQYECPEWFRDAKFGIWAHWSAQCQPEQGDWYARHMYIQGHPQNKFHVETYGHPSKVGFKDICNLWKAEKWEPEKLIALYQRAGAKYFVALANHHCNFDCWNSKHHEWNSVRVGPKKDIVGLWAEAARKQGLRFGVTVHAARAWDWYDTAHGSDKEGPLKGVPYDGALTKADGKGQWWDGLDPADLYAPHGAARTPEARQAYDEKFLRRVLDLVDSYRPDLLYFDDGRMPISDEVGLQIAAHFYNASASWHQGKVEAVLNTKGMPGDLLKCLVHDFERGRADRLQDFPWQTDTCIGHWHYQRGLRYATADAIITQLVDIVSKNGNMLLNIPVRGDGTIDDEEARFLEEMAKWMDVNGEGIFGTRPWLVCGEGPRRTGRGSGRIDGRELRFTTKGDTLYAFAFTYPAGGKLVVRSLAKLPGTTGKVTAVALLDRKGELKWTHDEAGLAVTLPPAAEWPGGVYALKIACDQVRGFKPEEATRGQVEPLKPGPDGGVALDPDSADLHGSRIQVEQRANAQKPNIGFWDSASEWASWTVRFPEPGAYEVTARYATIHASSEFVVEVAGQALQGKAETTGSWDTYKEAALGRVEIKAAGDAVIAIRPRDAESWKPINLLEVRLAKSGPAK